MIEGAPILPKGWKPTSDAYADNTVGYSFSYYLLPPSKNFTKNMGQAEKTLLLEHARYLKEAGLRFEESLDHDTQYGLDAWLPKATEMEIRQIAANDSAIKANLGFHVRYHKLVSQGLKRRAVVRDETGKEVSW